jgi:phage tail sheath protein FI
MAVTPTYPGVYVEELPSGARTITGVSTSVAAFVGTARRGPVHRAVQVLSYADFERIYGGLDASSEMSYAVRQFFANGGTQAWIVRVAARGTAAASLDRLNIFGGMLLRVTALDAGIAGNNIELRIEETSEAFIYNVSLSYTAPGNPSDSRAERFDRVSTDSRSPRYLVNVINEGSRLVRAERRLTPAGTSTSTAFTSVPAISPTQNTLTVSINGASPVVITLDPATDNGGTTLVDRLNALATAITNRVRTAGGGALDAFRCTVTGNNDRLTLSYPGEGSTVQVMQSATNDASGVLRLGRSVSGTELPGTDYIRFAPTTATTPLTLQGGVEPAIAVGDLLGSQANREGIYALDPVDSFNLLCLPGITDRGVLSAATTYCESRRAFLIVDAPANIVTPQDMASAVRGPDLPKSDSAAVYYPWIRIADPLQGGRPRRTAPSGTIAGLYARIDASRGVWKAPAGTEASLAGVQALEYSLTDRENGTLNPLGVNCLRTLPSFGPVAWGARTLRGDDAFASPWKYIPVRRLALYLEESLYRGTQWVVFEPNDEPLWAQIRLNLNAFMQTLFRQGAFQGRTPREAYFVQCDRETTTQDDINRGIVNIVVGFAPLKPAEFVILKIQQIAGQGLA